jgi:hypothetical protein
VAGYVGQNSSHCGLCKFLGFVVTDEGQAHIGCVIGSLD